MLHLPDDMARRKPVPAKLNMDQSKFVMAIRRARPDDVKPIEALETRAFASDRLSARSLRDYLKSRSATVLVAEDNAGCLAGYAIVRFRRATSVARLYSIAVADGVRGQEIGRASCRERVLHAV